MLIGPALERGLDLKDDLCRAILIPKVPYGNLGDAQVSARKNLPDGQGWYASHTLRTLVQGTGRGMRHEGDWCNTHVLDAQFPKLMARSRWMVPEWWHKAVVNL